MSATSVLLLASASPRRRELLAQIGVHFVLREHAVDEQPRVDEQAEPYVIRMAQEKAADVAGSHPGDFVLGADTAVICAGEILGKPRDEQDALAMLGRLSGRTHQVLSAVSLCRDQEQQTRVSRSDVRFRRISDAEMRAYWRSGEPADKAGAYAIQGLGAVFVESLQGSYSGVMGLPLFETAQLLRHFSLPTALEQESA